MSTGEIQWIEDSVRVNILDILRMALFCLPDGCNS